MSEEQKKKPRKVMPFEITIAFRKEVTLSAVGGGDSTGYTEINLREPESDEISKFLKKNEKENAVDSIKYLASMISGVPIAVLGKLGATDYYKIQTYLLYFLTPPDEDDPEGNEVGSP